MITIIQSQILPPQFFLRSHTQRVKHLRKVAKTRICRKPPAPSHQEMMSLSCNRRRRRRGRRRPSSDSRADAPAKRLPRNYDCYSQDDEEHDDLINQNMEMKCSTTFCSRQEQTKVIINPINAPETSSVVLRKSSLNRTTETTTNKIFTF